MAGSIQYNSKGDLLKKTQFYEGPNITEWHVSQETKGNQHLYKYWQIGSAVESLLEMKKTTAEEVAEYVPSVTAIARSIDGDAVIPISRWSTKLAIDKLRDQLEGDYHFEMVHEIEEDQWKDMFATSKAESTVVLKKAGDRGTRIHNAIEEFINPKFTPLADEDDDALFSSHWTNHLVPEDNKEKLQITFHKFQKWMNGVGFKVKATEAMLFHNELEVAGTADAILSNDDDAIYIIDFKTGSNTYWKDKLQVSGYASCLMQMVQQDIEVFPGLSAMKRKAGETKELKIGGAVVHLQEDKAKTTLHHLDALALSGIPFLSAMALYKAKKEKGIPKEDIK